tara:strand:+ start:67 stop:477 length:411 start_codon:yes stop_codon:yes gene_type:complete
MKVNSRRRFLQKAGLATAAIASGPLPQPERNKELFIHHVLFYLKNKNNAQDEAKLLEGLHKLAKVPSIQYVHIGTPAGTSRPVIVKDYTFSWMCIFKNIIEQEIYQTDPIHLKFVEDYSHLWEKVVIYDAVGPKKV